MKSRLWALGLLGVAGATLAGTDVRGWTSGGTVAAEVATVVGGPEVQTIELPKELVKRLQGPTLLVYFSPTCPHCQHVAGELQALHQRLEAGGWGRVLGVASGSSTPESIASFEKAYGVTFPIVVDADRAIAQAIAARSTPSALLVRPVDKARVEVVDLWYPYVPGLDRMVEGRARGDMMSVFEPGRYMGTTFCGTCHRQELEGWQLTHHAVAWRTLERKEATADPECVGCHVTGHEKPGGWGGDPFSALVDVGCESCHGPSGPHDGAADDPKAACVGCHDAKHSLGFDLAVALPLVDHFAATVLTPEQVRERRLALHDGTAPQELIRFTGGKNLGAAACLRCHPTEHAAWVESPHAHAMRTLQAKGSDQDIGCVPCHATPKVAGPPPGALDGYRSFEGVSCESCHGPGEAHVAAEGAPGTIEGLGEDCPVCVIEAVCTTCHTPSMDPTWDLEADLEKVRHGQRSK